MFCRYSRSVIIIIYYYFLVLFCEFKWIVGVELWVVVLGGTSATAQVHSGCTNFPVSSNRRLKSCTKPLWYNGPCYLHGSPPNFHSHSHYFVSLYDFFIFMAESVRNYWEVPWVERNYAGLPSSFKYYSALLVRHGFCQSDRCRLRVKKTWISFNGRMCLASSYSTVHSNISCCLFSKSIIYEIKYLIFSFWRKVCWKT